MKFRLSVIVLLSAAVAWGATVPVYINSGTVQSPPGSAPLIDAVTFINEAYFEVNDFSANPLPYQTINTWNFTNTASGIMMGHPGYFFQYVSGNTRGPMANFENRGSISSFNSVSNFFISFTTANWLLVDSDRIINSGNLNASASGLIRLTGNTVNVSRGRMRAGEPPQRTFFFGANYLYQTNYFNDPGISDVYWGVGTNGNMALDLSGPFSTPNFSPTNVSSAVHTVVERFGSFLFTNTFNTVPQFGSAGAVSRTYVATNGSDVYVQAVFVTTNLFNTNTMPEITFVPDFVNPGPAIVQVGFHTVERDIALDQDIVSSLYVIDGLGTTTNATLSRNSQVANSRRPNTYSVSKGPYATAGLPGSPSGALPLYRSSYSNNVVTAQYAAFSAQLAAQSFTGSDPTNFPGRVEIIGQNVNLRDSRIRAESTISITANNLLTNRLGSVSAPYLNFDLGTSQPLIISNVVPSGINRLSGTVSAWSAIWNNTDTNMPGTNIHFHVMVLEPTLQTTVPVTVSKFMVRAPRVQLHDSLTVNQRLRVDSSSVHVRSNAGLTFPANWAWGNSNMVNVMNFTNDGVVTVPGAAVLGTDRGFGYSNIINRGRFSAPLYSVLGDYFENWGDIQAHSGNFRFDGRKACVVGTPFQPQEIITATFVQFPVPTIVFVTNIVYPGAGTFTARGDLTLNANSIILSNAVLKAGSSIPGSIILTPSLRLTDGGIGTTNLWQATGGIRVMQRPTALSDLMGTYATVTAPDSVDVLSTWAANDVGAIALGYSNNLALGKLTLDGGQESIIRFGGLAGKKNAIYVDYLELLNNATNFDSPDPSLLGLVIEPSLTLYFAHANIDAAKLDGKQNGRIRWVKGFMGPLSTTNIVYPSGEVYPVNISLARHKDYDSDGDGTPNNKDSTPVYSPESVKLTIGRDTQPNRVLLSWQALANSTSHVEYKTPIGAPGPWQILRSTTAPVNMRISVSDPATGSGRTQRIYRVRVDLPPQ